MNGMSLLDVLRDVMLDPVEQAAYSADPGAYLARHGYDDVDPAHLSEAFGLVADTLPAEQAQAVWPAAAGVDDSAFGTVAPDVDDPSLDDADATATQPEGEGEGEAAVSFGYGDSDFADTDADDADLTEPATGEPGTADAGAGIVDADDRGDDRGRVDADDAPRFGDPTGEIDDADTSFTDETVDFGDVADDHDAELLAQGDEPGQALLDAALGEEGGIGLDLGDDVGHVATDELDDTPPEDLDIGSF
jgi:hypothetical protein